MKRFVLFIPRVELQKHFHLNQRQDVKIITPEILNDILAEKLIRRGKSVKKEDYLIGNIWTHSDVEDPNKICESEDFMSETKDSYASGPVAISFANKGSVESFHYHKHHWEIYFSEHRLGSSFIIPGEEEIRSECMDEGGAIVFSPGVKHKMEIYGLTIVIETPGIKGDRDV